MLGAVWEAISAQYYLCSILWVGLLWESHNYKPIGTTAAQHLDERLLLNMSLRKGYNFLTIIFSAKKLSL